jgi:hypothetical protein
LEKDRKDKPWWERLDDLIFPPAYGAEDEDQQGKRVTEEELERALKRAFPPGSSQREEIDRLLDIRPWDLPGQVYRFIALPGHMQRASWYYQMEQNLSNIPSEEYWRDVKILQDISNLSTEYLKVLAEGLRTISEP